MANKPLNSIKFPGLPDTYVVPQVDTSLSVSGKAADAKATGDRIAEVESDIEDVQDDLSTEVSARELADENIAEALETKADKNGTSLNLTVGTAEQLLSSVYEEDKVPYKFRHSGGDVETGNREMDEIVGGSIAWNQLIDTYNSSTQTKDGLTKTVVTEGGRLRVHIEGTYGTPSTDANIYSVVNGRTLINGHRYLASCSDDKFGVVPYNHMNVIPGGIYANKICTATANATDGAIGLRPNVNAGTVVNSTFDIQFIDLTQMFGSTIADYIYSLEQTTAGVGVAWFRKLFPDSYYPYNARELIHVSGLQSHDTVGFNLFDEECELGGIYYGTGLPYDAADRIRSKNYIPCLPNTSYHIVASGAITLHLYDTGKNWIRRAAEPRVSPFEGSFTTPENAAYLRICFELSYGAIYKHDTCINFSVPLRDGTYEPYIKHSYPLDDSLTLRGIPKLDANNKLYYDGDIYEADGTVTRRYDIVDLGTLNWYATDGVTYFYTDIIPTAIQSGVSGFVCSKYVFSSESIETVSNCYGRISNGRVYLKDSAYTSASDFKTAMNGVYLVYELATPTTESAKPYQNPQILDSQGTEEYVSTSIVPVGHNTKYPEDAVKKLGGLPKNFSTLIAPTEVTYKATRNYTVGSYLIVNNQLYKVTSAIANNGAITPGTNVTATTIMAELIALT